MQHASATDRRSPHSGGPSGSKQLSRAIRYLGRQVNPLDTSVETPQYGLFDSFQEPLYQGLFEGMKETAHQPISGVKISILNTIMDPVYSTQVAFELLGKWLVVALVLELYKRGLIEKP